MAFGAAGQTPPPAKPQVFVALYERGPAWDDAKGVFEQTLIKEHMQFLRANWDRLLGAAPFAQGIAAGSSDKSVGMVLVSAASLEEAQSLIAGDPAVSGNLMKAPVRRWLVERLKPY
jgi:hypothetical protein